MSLFWKKILIRSGIASWIPSVRRLLGPGTSFLRHFSDRTLSCPIDAILDPALFPDIQGPGSLNLAMSAPRCDLPLGALRGINDHRPLPAWGLPELRDVLLVRHRERFAAEPPATDEVLITHGATGAFATVIDTFVNPGSPVVLLDPTAPIFPIGLKHRRAKIRRLPTHLEEGKIRFSLEQLRRALRGAKLLVLADPCNPTGGMFSAEDLEQVTFWAKKFDVLIYMDESFSAFCAQKDRVHLAALPAAENRLLVANSLSMTYGLAAARVGWLVGNRHLLQACAVTSSMTAPFVSPLAQHVALTAVRSSSTNLKTVEEEFAGRRQYVYETLRRMGLEPIWNAAGYFFWVPTISLGMTGRDFSQQLLQSKRVLVNPGDPFGPSGKDYIRISFAVEEGRLREAMARLEQFLCELKTVQRKSQLSKVSEESSQKSQFGAEIEATATEPAVA